MTKRHKRRSTASLDDAELVKWAKRNVRGLDNACAFVGVMNEGPLSAQRVEFTLHVGHALLTNKPIIFAAPIGEVLPAKLEAVADRIVRYDPANLETMEPAVRKALVELGLDPQ